MIVRRLLELCRRRNLEPHGSAGWASCYSPVLPADSCRAIEGGSFFVGCTRSGPIVLPPIDAMRHGIIVGGSGTGKSRGYFLPNAAWSKEASLVCTDPKSELWRMTSGFHQRAVRFAPTEPGASECFNWIPLCAKPRIAELCARSIVESGNTQSTEQAWLDTESALLAGIFAHASTLSEPTPLSAYRLFTRQTVDSLIAVLDSSPSEVAREQGMIFSQTQERMRGSIVPVLAAKLQFLRDDDVARFTSASLLPPNFASLRVTPCATYWCLREADIVRLRPLTSLFFSLLIEELAAGDESGGGVPVKLLFDEFANVGVIPNFETIISLARGRGLSIWIGIQSLGQLESRYGKSNAQTILSNCGTKIALSGLDYETAEYFSRSLGEMTAAKPKITRHGLLQATYSHATDRNARRLLTADEVRRIEHDSAIAIVGNHRPMMLGKIFYNEPPKAAETISLPVARSISISPEQREAAPVFPESLFVRKRLRRITGRRRSCA